MATSYVVGIRIQYPAGTNLSNVQSTLRNEHTNESETLTTNSSGEVIWNIGNLPSGFARGDKITVFSLYQGFQQSFSFSVPSVGESVAVKDNSNVSIGTATGGGLSGTMVLVAVPTAPSLRYFTVQEFLDYYNLKEYNAVNDDGIKTQQIVLVGQSVELEIENMARTKFDSNSGAYYSVTDEYHTARYSRQRDYFLKNVPVIRLSKFEVTQQTEGFELDDFENLVYDQLDAMDATTGWTAGSGGSITLNSTPSQVNEGSAALNLVKSGTSAAAVTYSKTFDTTYDFFEREIKVDFFIADNTNLAATDAIAIRFGTNSSNYYEQTFDRTDINNNSWDTVSFKREDTGVTVTGSPGTSSLNYFAIVVTMTTAATTVAAPDMRLDDLRLNEKDRIVFDTDTGHIRITDTIDNAEVGARHVRATYTHGRSTVPVDIKHLAIVMTASHILGSAFMRSRIGDHGTATEAQLDWFDNFKMSVINKYRNPNVYPT